MDLGRVAQGTGGFVIAGRAGVSGPPTLFGYSAASAGDINGDGFDDVIVGAPKAHAYADGRRSLGGEAMVVFGRAGSAGTRITLAAIEAGSGSGGFVIHGAVSSGRAGISVASAGDINGDGFDDLVIGADRVEGLGLSESGINKASAGATYVVYGKAAGFGGSLDLAQLTAGSSGFVIYGADARDQAGRAVAAAGDINGDGFGDLIIGAPGGDLAGDTKFRTYAGEAYVVYGKAGGFDPSIDLTGIATGTGATGFVLYGHLNDQAGYSVAAAGDINGDGLDDFLIGAKGANGIGNPGDPGYREKAGATYVVFGKAELFSPKINLDDVAAGTGGFIIRGRDRFDGTGTSVASAGDINGDGFDDLVVGAPGAYAANNAKRGAGETTIIYGRNFSNTITQSGGSLADTLTGTAGADDMVGGRGNDILIGNRGADVLLGGSGNDTIVVSDLGFARVDGDGGIDSLALDGAGMTLDLSTIANTRLRGIERIDLTGRGNNTLLLTPLEVLNLSDSSNTLIVDGNAGDGVLLAAGNWLRGAVGGGYVRYSSGQASLRINTAVTVLSATPSVPDLVAASDTGQSSVDNITKLATPLLTGSAEATASVTLFEGATIVGSGKANASGVWSIKTNVLTNGAHDIFATAVSATGRPSLRSGILTVVIDTIAPISVGAPGLDAASDSGVSPNDRITSVTTPLIIGQTEANMSVTVSDGLTVLGTTVADAAGKWSLQSPILAAGSHSITARVTDIAGNTGPPSAVLTMVVDTTVPAVPSIANMAPTSDSGVSTTDDLTRIATPVFIGTAEAIATVTLFDGAVQIGTGKANAAGVWSIQSAALSDGVHQIQTQAMDAAGNVSPFAAALAITIDTVPGAPPILERATLGAISGSADTGVTVSLFEGATKIGSAIANGSGSWTAPIALTAGAHAIAGMTTDLAGNNSALSAPVSVLIGSALDDLLTGGLGADLMGGGPGNDTYLVNDVNDVVGEIAAEGTTDTVIASVSHALAAGSQIEFLRAADGVFDIALTGNALVNTVIGGSGNDTLTDGGAADVLTGGGGADLFVLTVLSDSIAPISGRDRITDFSSLAGDRIDLHLLDANANLFGDQAFTFVGLAGFSGSAGELNYGTGVDSRIQGDVNGDSLPDFAILLSGVRSLTASDFVL